MAFIFSADNLRKLLRVNSYEFSQANYLVFGIRGAAASGTFDTFSGAHSIQPAALDYKTPQCLIGIWKPAENQIALFPGSTVPNLQYIKGQVEGRAKSNCMMTGYYQYYEKGYHNPGPNHAHQALRLATNIALRRSYDDYQFTNTDPIEVGNPNDNIHAAYIDTVKGNYSSAGCQVIAGQPECRGRAGKQNTLYWRKFHDAIYGTSQHRFSYALFRCADASIVSTQGAGLMQGRLRFGSQGSAVLELQQAMAQKGLFYTHQDGVFGRNTLQAVLAFQTQQFSANDADGVVGNQTAAALGITLPMI